MAVLCEGGVCKPGSSPKDCVGSRVREYAAPMRKHRAEGDVPSTVNGMICFPAIEAEGLAGVIAVGLESLQAAKASDDPADAKALRKPVASIFLSSESRMRLRQRTYE